jgi:regulator of microtubule dynamics protein 3
VERSALVHKWLAIIHNALGERRGAIRDRVEGGVAFDLHTKKALEIDPSDPTLHYMAGRFCFDVSGLSWLERQGARAISGKEPPKATYQEALQHYQNALALKESPAFFLEIGKCFQKLRDESKALESFKKAATFVPAGGEALTIEEVAAREEAREILRKSET